MTTRLFELLYKRFRASEAALFLCTSLLVLLVSCKDDEVIGLEVQPEGEQLGLVSTDSFTLEVSTVREEGVRTDETVFNLLGRYNDPEFGSHSSSIVTHFRLSSEDPDFGDVAGIQVDSVILSMSYGGFYGTESDPQSFKVYRLGEIVHVDSSYLSNVDFAVGAEIGSATITPNTEDSVTVNGEREPAQLRIPIDPLIGQELIDGSVSSYSTNQEFINFFNGIVIAPDSSMNQAPGEGGIFYFNLRSVFSRMTVYYRDADGDTLNFEFIINDSCARISHFDHNYTGSSVLPFFNDKEQAKDKLFLQAMDGTKLTLDLPDITSLADKGIIVINKAELELFVEDDNYDPFAPPTQIFVIGLDEDGTEISIPDQFAGETHYGGFFLEDEGRYRFNITRYLQDLIDQHLAGNDVNYGMRIVVGGSAISANRVILKGSERDPGKINLTVSYTPLK